MIENRARYHVFEGYLAQFSYALYQIALVNQSGSWISLRFS